MAATVKLYEGTVTETTTVAVDRPRGGKGAATYYADVSDVTAGDTWTVAVTWKPGGTAVTTGLSGNITNPILSNIAAQSPFTLANRANPMPDQIVITNTVASGTPSITLSVWAILAD